KCVRSCSICLMQGSVSVVSRAVDHGLVEAGVELGPIGLRHLAACVADLRERLEIALARDARGEQDQERRRRPGVVAEAMDPATRHVQEEARAGLGPALPIEEARAAVE